MDLVAVLLDEDNDFEDLRIFFHNLVDEEEMEILRISSSISGTCLVVEWDSDKGLELRIKKNELQKQSRRNHHSML